MQHATRTTLTALALGIAGALAFGSVHASGFQLKENSVKGLGAAFSGVAVDDSDSSVVLNNPAVMTQFTGTTLQADVSVVDVQAEFTGNGQDLFGRPITGGNGGDGGGAAAVPAMSMVHKFDNGLAVGAMVSAPFGLKTEYEPDWVGRYTADTSDLKFVNLTLSAALDLSDQFSVGAGLVYSHADVTLSKSVDFGALIAGQLLASGVPAGSLPAYARPQASDGFFEIRGTDNALGYVFGLNFRPTDKLSMGLSYQSEIDYQLSGDADWTVPTAARATFDASPTTQPLFRDGGGSAPLTTPSTTTFGVSYQATEALKVMGNYAETGWSSLQDVRIDFSNPDPEAREEFRWGDTRFWSVGTEFKLNDAWMLRAGYGYDETPTTYQYRTPRLPDEDRRWYSIGATWTLSEALEVNLAYTFIQPDTPKVGIIERSSTGARVHTLFGEYDSTVNILGVSAQYRF